VDTVGPSPGPGRLAIPVRLADEAVAARLRPGMRVRLIGVADSGSVTVLTPDALVLTQFDARASPSGPLLVSVAAGDADRVTAGSLLGQLAVQFV
jgi:pilus assembly protein CpaB